MARLYRPHIPLPVRCQVAARQLRERGIQPISTKKLSTYLFLALDELARAMKCERSDLRLDHDPPLGARPQERRGLSKKTFYTPDANDPEHLFYRPHGAQFERSHDVKTRIRGDHGQYPDIVLIKRERRRQRRKAKPETESKFKTQKQKMKSRSAWPPRGSCKIPNRKKPL